jgi:hypothetical protein
MECSTWVGFELTRERKTRSRKIFHGQRTKFFVAHYAEYHYIESHNSECHYAVYLYMKNTYCLFQIKFITEYPNVQHIIITQI